MSIRPNMRFIDCGVNGEDECINYKIKILRVIENLSKENRL